MLRHSRDIVRAQRKRWIKRRANLLSNIWIYYPYNGPFGKLAKFNPQRNRCSDCLRAYNRAKEKQELMHSGFV